MKFREKAAPYIEAGWQVFPIVPGTRKFFAKRSPDEAGGFYWATLDPDQIDAWGHQWPDANIAVRTGGGSGLVVVDLDFGKAGRDEARRVLERLSAKSLVLPESSVKARSPSGGEHWFYRYVGPLCSSNGKFGAENGKDGSKIDIKADGGLIYLPPTFVDGKGSYRWLKGGPMPASRLPPFPRWAYDLLKPKPTPVQIQRPAFAPGRRNHRALDALVKHCTEMLDGKRDDALYWASKRAVEEAALGRYSATDAFAAIFDAGRRAGQPEYEIERALRDLKALSGNKRCPPPRAFLGA